MGIELIFSFCNNGIFRPKIKNSKQGLNQSILKYACNSGRNSGLLFFYYALTCKLYNSKNCRYTAQKQKQEYKLKILQTLLNFTIFPKQKTEPFKAQFSN